MQESTIRSSMRAIVPASLIAVGMVYSVVRMAIQKFAPIGLLVPLGLVIIWLVWRVRQPARSLITPLALPFLACGASLVVSSLLSNSTNDLVLAMLFHWGAVAVLIYLSADILAHGFPPRYFAYGAIITSTYALLVSLSQVSSWAVGWALLWQPGEALFPVTFRKALVASHPNQTIVLFYLGIPFAIAMWWQATRRWQQVCWMIWTLVAVLMLFVTGSRGGWFGTSAAIAVILGPLLVRAAQQSNWRRIIWTLALGTGYSAIFLALLLANRQSLETQRGGSLFSSTGRTLYWSRALDLAWERPLFGAGPTGYATYYNAVEPTSRIFRPGHAHSMYLTALSEMGLVGCAAIVFTIVVTIRIWWRGWRRTPSLDSGYAPSNEPRLMLLSCAALFVGLAAHGFVEVPVPQLLGIAMYAMTTGLTYGGGWRLGPVRTTMPKSRWLHLYQTPAIITFLVILTWGISTLSFVTNRRADWLTVQEQQSLSQSELKRAYDRATVALAYDPSDESAQRVWAMMLARLAEGDSGLLPAAIDAQKRTAESNPADYIAPINQAMLLVENGQMLEAENVLRHFIARDTSYWGLPYLLLAHIQEQKGDQTALYSWREMLRRQPDLANSAACRRSPICISLPVPPSDTATLRAIQLRINQRDPTVFDELTSLAQQRLSVDMWATAALAAGSFGNDHGAQRFLRAAIDQSEMIGSAPTRLLGLALLRDALRHDDRTKLPSLVSQWAIPAEPVYVPQLTALTTTNTDGQIAASALEAAQRLGDERLVRQAQAYQRNVQQALASVPLQQAGSR